MTASAMLAASQRHEIGERPGLQPAAGIAERLVRFARREREGVLELGAR